MNHASLKSSARLRRTLKALIEAKGWVSTATLIRRACICAVNSVIAELRENGCDISCEQRMDHATGKRRWVYRLNDYPKDWNENP